MKLRFFLVGALLACWLGCSRKVEPEPIVIGHVVPLSGADKTRGEHAKQGIALAVEEANAEENRVLERRIIVTHADTRSDPSTVRAVVKRLLTVDRVHAILGGPETAAIDNAIGQLTGVPFLLSGSRIVPAGGCVFFTGLSSPERGETLGRFAQEEWHAGKFAVVTDGKHEYEAAGFTHTVSKDSVVGTWAYDVADKLPALAKEAAEKKPAAILFAGKSEELLRWLRVDAVAKVPVLFSDDEDRLVWPQAAPPGATIYSLTAFSALDDSPALKEFVGKYQERFGEAPDAAAALAYDDARLLFEAIRRAKSVEPAKLCAELAGLRCDGLTGPLAFGKGNLCARSVYVVKSAGEKTTIYKRYAPEEK